MLTTISISAAIGSIIGPLAARAIRWAARKTRTKRDDKIADAIANFLEDHPEVIDQIAKRVK